MPDIIQLPKISVTVMGESYPVHSVSVDLAINSLLSFEATIMTSDADKVKDGGDGDGVILDIETIRRLAGKMQSLIYEKPEESNIQLSISGYNQNDSLVLQGVLTEVECVATTDGGLSCKLGANSNDVLLSVVNYNTYLDYVNTHTAAAEIFKTNGHTKDGPVYCLALSPDKRESTSDPITKRVKSLIEVAEDKWETFSKLKDQPQQIQSAIRSVSNINKQMRSKVDEFLQRSDKTSTVLDNKCKINKATANQIMNGLHTALFAAGNNFLQAMFMICGQYELWYVPKLKDKGLGYLENSKFGNEESATNIAVYGEYFNFHSGDRWQGRAPCLGVVMRAQSYVDAASKSFSTRKTPASRLLTQKYPEKETKDFGATYILNAPGWVSLPVLSAKDSNTVDKSMSEQFKKGELERQPRDINQASSNFKLVETKQKDNIDSSLDILSYLAKKYYYRILLDPSTAIISGAYSGPPEAEVGDIVNVELSPSGQIVKGILSSIRININPVDATINYGISGATINESSIK